MAHGITQRKEKTVSYKLASMRPDFMERQDSPDQWLDYARPDAASRTRPGMGPALA